MFFLVCLSIMLSQAVSHPLRGAYNETTVLPGWGSGIPTTNIRVELRDGIKDGWGMNKMFGIRNVRLLGWKGD